MKLQFKRSVVDRIFKTISLASNKVNEKMKEQTLDKIYKETVELSETLRQTKNNRPQDKRIAKNLRKFGDTSIKVTPERKKVIYKVLPNVDYNNFELVNNYNLALKEATKNIKTLSWKEVKERQKAKIGKVDNSSLNRRFITPKQYLVR